MATSEDFELARLQIQDRGARDAQFLADGSKNQDAFFALLHESTEFVPVPEPGDVAGVRFLRTDEQHIVKTVAMEASDGLEIVRKGLTVAGL